MPRMDAKAATGVLRLPPSGRRNSAIGTLAALAATLLLAAAGEPWAGSTVVVTRPWVRATVEGQTATAAYMTLASDRDLVLVAVSSPVAGRAAIHEMQMRDGRMTMRPVPRLTLGAGRPVSLRQGHFHVMLEAIKRQLKAGETVRLTLRLTGTNGAQELVEVTAPVRALEAGDSDGDR